jgi:hypothetical protein
MHAVCPEGKSSSGHTVTDAPGANAAVTPRIDSPPPDDGRRRIVSTPKAVLSLNPFGYGDGDALEAVNCPRCGESTGLHFDTVLFGGAGGVVVQVDAQGEDAGAIPDVRVTSSRNASAAARAAEAQLSNPRRHFIKILGWCEHCGGADEGFGLLFQQHKGMTYFALTAEPLAATE